MYIYIYKCIAICICIHTHIYIYICAYTHIHTQRQMHALLHTNAACRSRGHCPDAEAAAGGSPGLGRVLRVRIGNVGPGSGAGALIIETKSVFCVKRKSVKYVSICMYPQTYVCRESL